MEQFLLVSSSPKYHNHTRVICDDMDYDMDC
jgi:hypothetical protein